MANGGGGPVGVWLTHEGAHEVSRGADGQLQYTQLFAGGAAGGEVGGVSGAMRSADPAAEQWRVLTEASMDDPLVLSLTPQGELKITAGDDESVAVRVRVGMAVETHSVATAEFDGLKGKVVELGAGEKGDRVGVDLGAPQGRKAFRPANLRRVMVPLQVGDPAMYRAANTEGVWRWGARVCRINGDGTYDITTFTGRMVFGLRQPREVRRDPHVAEEAAAAGAAVGGQAAGAGAAAPAFQDPQPDFRSQEEKIGSLMQLGFLRVQVEDALYLARGDVAVAGERLAQEQDAIEVVSGAVGCAPFEAYRALRRVNWRVAWAVEDLRIDMQKDNAERQKRRQKEQREQQEAAKAAAERQVQLIGERLVELEGSEPAERREAAKEYDTAHKLLWDTWLANPAAEGERRRAQHKQAAKAKAGGGASKPRLQTELKKLRRDGLPTGIVSFGPDREDELTTTQWTAELTIPHGARVRLTVRPGGDYPKVAPEVRVDGHGAGACAAISAKRRARLPIAAVWKAKNQLIDAVADCARLFEAAAAGDAPAALARCPSSAGAPPLDGLGGRRGSADMAGTTPPMEGLPTAGSSSFYDIQDDADDLPPTEATLVALGWTIDDARVALRAVGGDGGRAAALLVGDDIAAGLE